MDERGEWYGITAVPWIWLDGKYEHLSGESCDRMLEYYRDLYLTRMAETGGLSPIRIDGLFRAQGDSAEISATCTLVDPAPQGTLQATLFIYEDDITWCCGYGGVSEWSQIPRYLDSEPVTLDNQGDSGVVTRKIAIPAGWDRNRLHGVALVQSTSSPHVVVQSARLDLPDFTLDFACSVGSVPAGTGTVMLEGTVHVTGDRADVLDLSVDGAFGWPVDFQVAGDPTWYTSRALPVSPGEDVEVTVRVRTDEVKRIGVGAFVAASANTGRYQNAHLRVFNGSPAVLLVDDDNGQRIEGVPAETSFLHALDGLACLYEHWDVYIGHGRFAPVGEDMCGFDMVIWSAADASDPITPVDRTNLMAYMDAGGGLYLDSSQFLMHESGWDAFRQNYLGIESWTNNTRCHTASGVGGDPITSGLVLPLYFESDNENRVDTTNPTADAHAILFSEHIPSHPAAIRHETERFRSVFSTIRQAAFSEIAPAPNNNQTLVERILAWLSSTDVSAAPSPSAAGRDRLLDAYPNPAARGTEVAFTIPSDAGDVRLMVIDAAGRAVCTLAAGQLAEGRHRRVWDGKDSAGRPAGSGVYFVQLRTRAGQSSRKLVILE